MAGSWNKPLTDMIDQVDDDKRRLVSSLILYAEGQFKQMTPVLTGQLKRSFSSAFSRNKLFGTTGSNLPYAESVWVRGSERGHRLPPMAVDLIIANMMQLPVSLRNV